MGLELKTTNTGGEAVGSVTLDEGAFGGFVKNKLLHAATVMYHNNLRQGGACTKTRAEIAGSTKKLFRQKGTGRARAGTRKSGVRKGGGVIHGPKPRNFVYRMPKKQRQAALRTAILGKAKDSEFKLVSGLDLEAPKTKSMIALFKAIGLDFECDSILVATDGVKRNVFLSARNMPGIEVLPAQEINARHVLMHKHLVMDQAAFERMNTKPERGTRARKPKGSRKQTAASGGEEA